ncbi:MAG: gliding motility-associated-like protein [Saprospiraceae bacterium]
MKTKITFILSLLISTLAWGTGFLMQENKGQFDDKVLFKAPLNYGAVFIEKNKLTFVLHDKAQLDKLKNDIHYHGEGEKNDHHDHQHSLQSTPETNEKHFNSHSFSITFVGANSNSITTGKNAAAHYYNYFLGSDQTKWASNVKAYKDLWIRNLYDGIDFHMYGKENNIKYDFIIAPNASLDKIKLLYKGINQLKLLDNKIEIITSVGTLTDERPYSFNTSQRSTGHISTFYKLSHNVVSYQVNDYNHNDTLVLDPILNFATFSGSTIDNWGFTATYDNDDNAFGGGVCFGTGYPVTAGAYQSTFGGGPGGVYAGYPTDMSISKFSADGNNLIYATYLGGSKLENPHSLVVSPNNELIVFGTTSSRDFPMSASAYDNTFNGGATVVVDNVLYFEGSDIVVTKFSADGSTLIGSTYFGGSSNDGFNDESYSTGLYHNYSDVFRGEVITDAGGNAYIATTTSSSDLPIVNGFQSTYGGGTHDGCVVKFNSDLSQVLWSTYLGGSSSDGVYALQSNSIGELYVTGGTISANFQTSGSANQTSLSGGIDGFVARINNTGSVLLSSTFIGSSAYDQGYFVQVDEDDKVYVMGQTLGSLPISGGTYNNPNSGLFIHKYSSDLSSLEVSTIVGNGSGSTDIVPSAFLVDNCKKVYISGWAGLVNGSYSGGTAAGLPITSDAFQSGTDGSDFYLMVLEEDFAGLNYSTFFGSPGAYEHVDGGTSRFNKSGTVYQAVCAACGSNQSSFPVTPGAYSTILNSPNCNMAVFKFDASKLTARINPISDTLVCQNDTIHFYNESNGGTEIEWRFHDGTTSNDESPWKIFNTPGEYQVVLIVNDPTICPGSDTTTMTFTVKEVLVPTINSADSVICEGNTTTIVMNETANYIWYEQVGKVNSFQTSFTFSPIISTTLYITRPELCSDTLLIPVEVINLPVANTFSAISCSGDTTVFPIPIQSDFSYSWNPINNTIMKNDSLYFYPGDSTTYELTVTGDCGSAIINYEVNVVEILPVISPDTTICTGDTILITASGGDSYSWSPASELLNSSTGSSVSYVGDTSIVFTVAISKEMCFSQDSVVVNVLSQKPSDNAYNVPLCDGDTAALSYTENTLFNYSWNHQNELTIANDSIYFYPSSSTSHELTITGLCGSAIVNYNIDVTTITPSIIPDSTICFGDSINLTTTGGDTYSWSPAINGTINTGNSPLFIGDDTTTFNVIITKNQCRANENVTISVNPPGPQPETHADSLCEGDIISLPLQIQGDFTYSWNTTVGLTFLNDSVIINPVESTLYELTITGLCGIELIPYDIQRTIITSNSSNDTLVCLNEDVPLFVEGGTSTLWTPAVNGNSSSYQQTFTGDTTTTFNISIFENQCVKQETITVNVLPARPQNNTHNATICENENTSLPFSSQSDFVYSWTPSTNLTTNGNEVTFDVAESTNYTLTIRGECGSAVVDYNIVVNTINDSISTPAAACQEDTVTLQAFGGHEYLWTPTANLNQSNISNPIVTVEESMSYFVDIMKNGCSKTREVKINAVPIKKQNIDREYTINFGEKQELNLSQNYNYQFTPDTYLNCLSCSYMYSEAEEDITYHFTYLDENRCPVKDSIKINVIYELYIPNSFSPDGNGLNDIFYAYSHKIENFHMDIYNRWGEVIFTSDDIAHGWDGNLNGHEVQIDVYVWRISYTKVHSEGTHQRVGTVTLIR